MQDAKHLTKLSVYGDVSKPFLCQLPVRLGFRRIYLSLSCCIGVECELRRDLAGEDRAEKTG